MTIAEFAKKRGVDQQTIYKYIKRHPELFNDHISGHPMQLDEAALRLLSTIYPEKNAVEVIEDTDAYRQLVAAQNKILKLQEQIHAYERMKADSEASERLLEQREEDNAWLKQQIEKLQNETNQERKATAEAKKDAEEARKEADRLRNRGFWARVFNK